MRLYILFACICLMSCHAGRPLRQVIDQAKYESRLNDSLTRKQQTGVDFYASGTSPVNWTLELSPKKAFVFTTTTLGRKEFYPIAPNEDATGKLRYTTYGMAGAVIINVYTESCIETQRKVDVALNGITYTGCGNDLYDYRLSDIWVLTKAGSTTFKVADFPKGLPRLVLNVPGHVMKGTDGCNNISASIMLKGSRLVFGEVKGMTGCSHPMIEKIYKINLSNQSVDYYIRDGKLYFYLADDSVLCFARSDK